MSRPRSRASSNNGKVYFAPLAVAYQPVEPPASVKAALDRRLFAIGGSRAERAGAAEPVVEPRLLARPGRGGDRRLRDLCRRALHQPAGRRSADRLVASLGADASDVSYLAVYDAATGEVALSHVSGERGAGRDYELWMVEGQNAPVSMGVIPAGDTARLAVKPEIRAKLDKGVALAISLEPAGGSPTGQPTTVVAVGGLQSI